MANDHSQSVFPNWLFASKCLSYQVLFLHNLVLRSNKLNHLKQKSFPSGGTGSPRPRWSSMLEAYGMRYHHHPWLSSFPSNCKSPPTLQSISNVMKYIPTFLPILPPGDVEDALKETSHQTWKTRKGSNPWRYSWTCRRVRVKQYKDENQTHVI